MSPVTELRSPEIRELQQLLQSRKHLCVSVSAWSVGMHIEHAALAIVRVLDALAKSEPPAPPSRFSIPRFVVMLTGIIPRGRAKAPESTAPAESASLESLEALILVADRRLLSAQELNSESWMKHPVFGPLKRDAALRFIRIHTRHHLRIIHSILRHSGDSSA
jgi:hypothetical protein